MTWSTDRRSLMKAGGAFLASLTTGLPQLAWSAEGKTLRLRVADDFQVVDPYGMIGELDQILQACCTVTLVQLPDMRQEQKVTPYAASHYEWTSPTTLAFSLHEGLKWTGDFGPVTAEDVKYSFERLRGSDSAWAYQFEKLDRVEVTGERTGILHLTEAFLPFELIALPYYGGNIVCKAATEAAGGSFTTAFPAECGPYLFDSWEQNAKITLKRNPDWPLSAPPFDVIEFYIVTDDQAALLAYEAGSFDFTRVAISESEALKAKPPADSVLLEAASTRYAWLTINMNAPTLQDVRVRRAIQLAYDGEAVLEGVYNGLVPRATGVVPAASGYAREANLYGGRDVEQAKALLAEAGAEGIVLQLYCTTDSSSLTTAQIIQASLAEAGIMVELQPTESAAYWALGDSASGEQYKSIELVLMNFAGGLDPSENLVWFRPDQIGIYNWSFFDNAEFEALFVKSMTETDPAARKTMFNRMEDLMEESGGFIFICFEPYLAVHHSRLEPVILADGHPDPTRFSLR
ncbi:ABC transporter substrate-binding protein [Pseudogemmobacter faecipullorum]|uniref:ABC transporter substrate-binding protein n=1 Tax=Pseudogemmobacter faecipullorum TaxID=2755041 RepID=A0ABS8CT72_9RHOB|nr:ABC transporter substrate-binding protein [Pseudogemmobacter faecipullorum]MCB5412010.1 ABC transporter substrate-binding protein [Pseudogemmobacter faecipullorum]